ncbi:MAG: GIY-YIG nuclease family protein [Synergistaceae bacterium]|nr:GIY-YIG nuclease family protein [Synergistaceae bacterium]
MKAIAINGSPRKNWNTAKILAATLDGAKSAGAETELVHLYDMNFKAGWTNDLKRRIYAHNSGTGCKYTRTRAPVELAYCEEFEEKRDAQRREYAIKKLPRQAAGKRTPD